MNKITNIFLNHLTELLNNKEKLDVFLKEITEKIKKERKENLLFGQTEEYKIALKNLNNYLDENKYASICDYQQLVTPEIDNKTFYALHAYAFEVEKVEQIVDIFPTDYVFHKGICFQKTYGQGTHYCACRYLDNKYVFCGENS